jgi:uncharacterized delta-60 repeat protein
VVAGLSYTVGGSGSNGDDEIALSRYNADGSLDKSFGRHGEVLSSIGAGAADAFGVAVQGDGKIVAAGRASTSSVDFAVVRYTSSGSLDKTFGSSGSVLTAFAGYADQALSVAIQSDGKIVAAGETNPGSGYDDFALARYTTSGSLDTSFGSGGKVTTDFAGGYDRVYAVAIQSDGKVLAAGRGGANDFGLARYNTDGSLDTAFGSGGKVTTDFFGGDDEALGVAIQSDGRVVAAGYARNATAYDEFALARYLGSASVPTLVAAPIGAAGQPTNFRDGWPTTIGAVPDGPLGVMQEIPLRLTASAHSVGRGRITHEEVLEPTITDTYLIL